MVAPELVVEGAQAGAVVDCGDGGERGTVGADLLRSLCRERREEVDDRGLHLRNALVVGDLDLGAVTVPFPLTFEGCRFESPLDVSRATLQELTVLRCELPGLLGNGVDVRGDLNLSGSTIIGALPTTASESRSAAVWLCESHVGGRLLCVDTVIEPGDGRAIQADRIRVGGTVRLIHDFTAGGEVRLLGARIEGSIDLTGAHLADVNGLALELAEAVVGGNIYLIGRRGGRGLRADGRLAMNSAQVAGRVIVSDATVTASTQVQGGNYSDPRTSGSAFSAARLSVGGDFSIEGRCHFAGRVELPLATLGRLRVDSDCRFEAPGSTALDLTNAELASHLRLETGVRVRGTLRLTGATIHGTLTLKGLQLSDPEGRSCLAAQSTIVDGDVELHALSSIGGDINFRAAAIGGTLEASGAKLHHPTAFTLKLEQAHVAGNVRLVRGFRSTGAVSLNRVTIEGRLDCSGATLVCDQPTRQNSRGTALEAYSATVRGGMHLAWTRVAPDINLTGASTSTLADEVGTWPERYTLTGFTYERFGAVSSDRSAHVWDGAARRAWLRRQQEFDAGSYEHAARVFRQHGYQREAEDILMAQRRDAARTVAQRPGTNRFGAVSNRARSALFGWTVGYGYRPGRVLWMLAALLIAVTVTVLLPDAQATFRATDPAGNVYATSGRLVTVAAPDGPKPAESFAVAAARAPAADPCGDGQVRCFNPIFYAVDTVVPLVTLGQRNAWYPNSAAPWGNVVDTWLNIATLLGWVLSSIFLLSFTRLARSA